MSARRAVQSRLPSATFEPEPQPCTKCRAPMALARIEPAKPGFDLRTFECSACNNADQYIIEYGTGSPWVLHVRDRSYN
jgi:hypothetical protein